MEAQGGASTPEPNKDILNLLLKPSSSGDLAPEPSHNPVEEEEVPVTNSGLLQVTERRQPLSSVSSLEVHFDLLDLTELTDMSDQELAEVFADSDEENHNDSLAGQHHHHHHHHQQPPLPPLPPLTRGGYTRSPSWTRCSRGEQPRDRKHHSDSENTDPFLKMERPK
ncbi:dysbindin domain-containing protein 1 [Paramormyrops kingsleyae]|uniref:Dysbindin domain-containing protein 1 n=1 Tax=Paramormyrops kingsleyae TaxID=1676925 RepID=A0A3B3Q4J2_9TELE|nr:dysbindin domain-containing protein 1 [Paramormyrops kingsleyae]